MKLSPRWMVVAILLFSALFLSVAEARDHRHRDWRPGYQSHWRQGYRDHWRQGYRDHWRQGYRDHWRQGYRSHWRHGYDSPRYPAAPYRYRDYPPSYRWGYEKRYWRHRR